MLNPVLVEATKNELIPLMENEEVCILKRNNIEFSAVTPHGKLTASGYIILTNHRVVFVRTGTLHGRVDWKSHESRFEHIENPDLDQPIFGAIALKFKIRDDAFTPNHLSGKVSYAFKSGGCAVASGIFFRLYKNSERFRASLYSSVSSGNFQSIAFQDPNDPTTLYFSQPIPLNQQNQQPYIPNTQQFPAYDSSSHSGGIIINDTSYNPQQPYNPTSQPYNPNPNVQPSYTPNTQQFPPTPTGQYPGQYQPAYNRNSNPQNPNPEFNGGYPYNPQQPITPQQPYNPNPNQPYVPYQQFPQQQQTNTNYQQFPQTQYPSQQFPQQQFPQQQVPQQQAPQQQFPQQYPNQQFPTTNIQPNTRESAPSFSQAASVANQALNSNYNAGYNPNYNPHH